MSGIPDASARQMLSFRLLLLAALTLLLSGCLFDGFELPENYRPAHPGATTPVANGAAYRFAPTAEVPATRHLRFIRTGSASYVMEQYVDLHKGKPPNVYVHHARFIPLSGNHYALYWRQVATRTQGYVLARLESRRLVLLGAGAREADLITFAARQGIKARKLATSGFALDTTDEGGVLTFLQKLTANSLTETAYTSQAEVPRATRDAAFEELGPHIVRLERRDLGDDDQVKELATYVRALADEGNGWGHYALARFAANGWGMPTDAPLARVQADAAIRSGVPQANQVYAGLHYHGIGQPANPAAAIPYARRAAEAGVPAAMGLLGTAYRDGLGVQADKDEARRWFRRAADAGRGDAHALWADLVLDHKTAEQDAQALAALETGMKMEDPNAFYLRGFMHENGRGGPNDVAAATAMFLAAAERGHHYSKYLAGMRLRDGQGIAKDVARGDTLMREAADAGIQEAKVALAKAAPTHAPAKKGCVEDWCKAAMAATDQHLKQQEVRKAELKGEIDGLKADQLKQATRIEALRKQQREDILDARRKIAGTLDMQLYKANYELLRSSLAAIASLDELAARRPPTDREHTARAAYLGHIAKSRTSISKLEGKHPLFVAPRLANGQIVVMHADGRRIALKQLEVEKTDPIEPTTLPRPGDQLLPSDAETALLPFEQAWSHVPADEPRLVAAVAELNRLARDLNCSNRKLAGITLHHRATQNAPALALDVGGALRYREQFTGTRNGETLPWVEIEIYAPLVRMDAVEVRAAEDGHCAEVIVRCRESAYCTLKAGSGSEVSTQRTLGLSFQDTGQARRAAELLSGLVRTLAATPR
jgi:hypothetical protein